MSKIKTGYYSSLRKSGLNWHDGQEDVTPFIKYILRTILAAYIDFEERVDYVDESSLLLNWLEKQSIKNWASLLNQIS